MIEWRRKKRKRRGWKSIWELISFFLIMWWMTQLIQKRHKENSNTFIREYILRRYLFSSFSKYKAPIPSVFVLVKRLKQKVFNKYYSERDIHVSYKTIRKNYFTSLSIITNKSTNWHRNLIISYDSLNYRLSVLNILYNLS